MSVEAEQLAPVWTPRPHQQAASDKIKAGIKRLFLGWHRRAGKDAWALHEANDRARKEPGNYWHLFPYQTQAKKAIWNGIDPRSGRRLIDQAFPDGKQNKADLSVELPGGSIWQLCGSDAYDRLVGSNPRVVVFSEWALCDPRAWEFLRPIIRENNGIAVFITTFRRRNHAWRMARRVRKNPEWWVDIQTVRDTVREDGVTPIISEADVQADRDEGMREALIQQEYYCNPMAAAEGAIYGSAMEKLIADERMTRHAFDPTRRVYASWSTKWDDAYTVIFLQQDGNESYVVGSKSYQFADLSDAVGLAETDYPWRVHRHILPPDADDATIALFEAADAQTDIAPDLDGVIKRTRAQVARTTIDNADRAWTGEDENNMLLIDALNGYRFTPNREKNGYTPTPLNTWEKHYARAFEVWSLFAEHGLRRFGRRPDYSKSERRIAR